MNQLKCEKGIIDLQAVETVPNDQIDNLVTGTPILYTIQGTKPDIIHACIITNVTREFKQAMKNSTICTVYKFKEKIQ